MNNHTRYKAVGKKELSEAYRVSIRVLKDWVRRYRKKNKQSLQWFQEKNNGYFNPAQIKEFVEAFGDPEKSEIIEA